MRVKLELDQNEIIEVLAKYFKVGENDIDLSGDDTYGIYADIAFIKEDQ